MPNILIKPHAAKPTTNDCIQLAVELGEFRAISGCGFDIAWTGDSMTLKITYWQDETYTALRLKFGHQFVTPELQKVAPPVSRPSPRPARTAKPTSIDHGMWTWEEMVKQIDALPRKRISDTVKDVEEERRRHGLARRYIGDMLREINTDEDPKRFSFRG